jgi:hypothetical protein
LRHLSDGKPLGCFPGEVSSYKDGQLMVDKPWEEGAIKVIRKAQVPVVPIYFHAKIVVYFTCYLKLVALFALQNCFGFSQNINISVLKTNLSSGTKRTCFLKAILNS